MRKVFGWLLLVGLAVALIINVTVQINDKKAEEVEATLQQEAIETSGKKMSIQTIDSQQQKVSLEQLRGKPVVLNFFATWCPPCKEELPELQAFYEKNKNSVHLIGLNYTQSEKGVEPIHNMVKKYKLTFPIWLDPDSNINDNFQVTTIPTTYILDKEGVVVARHIGPITVEQLEGYINKIQ